MADASTMSTTTPTGGPATTPVSTPSPLLVTSSASRSNYANNVTALQTATSNLNTAPSPGSYKGVPIKGGSDADIQAQIKAIDASQGSKTDTKPNPNGGTTTLPVPKLGDPVYDNTGKQVGTAQFNPNDGTPLKSDTTSTDTSTTNTGDSTTQSTDGTDTTRNAIDPTLRNAYDTSLVSLDQGIATAKANLQGTLSTLQNDPAATAAVNMIMAKYDQQIQLMKDKNKMLLGSDVTNAARGGSLQYANEMETNFMSEEQDKAAARVNDLITTETQMILKAQAAYKKGDVAAFDAASKSLDSANKEKTDAINKLLTQTDKIVKEKQTQAKINAQTAKDKVANDVKVSTSIAKTVADQIKASGITDPKKIDAFIQGMAQSSGIGNVDMLRSAVVKAQQDQSKFDLAQKNTQSIINKRNNPSSKTPASAKPGKDGSFSYTSDDISAYANLLNKGGKSPTGQVYAPRGSDSYVDPGAYTAALNDWVGNGGTPTGFNKKFPAKDNVSPDDYDMIPAAVRPKVKAATGSNPPV